VKLMLEPIMLDENGQEVEVLIDSADFADSGVSDDTGSEELLDAPG
jgi:hypothetical protein